MGKADVVGRMIEVRKADVLNLIDAQKVKGQLQYCSATLVGFGALMLAMPLIDPVRCAYPVELVNFL